MKNKFYTLFTLAICIFASCDKEDLENKKTGQIITFSSGVNTYETRVNESGDQWLKDDEIGIFMLSENNVFLRNNVKYSTVSAGTSTTFQTTDVMNYPTDGSFVRFVAYHPYSESVSSEYPINLSSQANQVGLDFMYASSTKNYNQSMGETVNLTFNHMLVKVILNVTADASVGDISDVQVSAKGMNTSAKFNFSSETLEQESKTGDIRAYKNTIADRYEFVLLPVADLASSHIIEFEVNGSTYAWTINKNNGNITQLRGGYKYTFNVNLTDTEVESNVEAEQGGSIAPWNPVEGNGAAIPDEEVVTPDRDAVTTVEELIAAIETAVDGETIYLDPTNPFYINNISESGVYTAKSISINKSITLEGASTSSLAYINAKAIEIANVDIDFTIRNIEFGGYTVNEETGIPTTEVTSTSPSYFIDIAFDQSVKNLTVENCFVHGIYNGIVRANRSADALYGNVTIVNNRFYNIGGNNGGFVACHADGTIGGTWVIQDNTVTGIGKGLYTSGNANKKTIVFPKKASAIHATISNNTFFDVTSGTSNYFIDCGDAAAIAGTYIIEKNIVIFTITSRGPRLGVGTVTIKDNAIYPADWTNVSSSYTVSNTMVLTNNPFGVSLINEKVNLNADFTPEENVKTHGYGDSRWLK